FSSTLGKALSKADLIVLNAAINIVPYYCLIAPLIILVLIRHGRFERSNVVRGFITTQRGDASSDMYFSQLTRSWSEEGIIGQK
ncbi:hypothetical protein PMAYCL1PPCAC_16511, partial [Pristionchus mayeri]